MKGKYLLNNLKEKDKHDGITLICTFSRAVLVPYFFAAFRKLKLPRQPIHLIIYDNTQDEVLKKALLDQLERLPSSFKSVRMYKSYLKGRGSIAGSGNEQFKNSKLWNIWLMWLKMKGMIHTETFFVLEDDTICPPNAFIRLMGLLHRNPRVGFATAIETGRSSMPWVPVRLGVHHVKMKGMKVLERHSLDPNTKGVVPIDAAGVYCFAARTKAYLSGFKNYDPVKLKVPFFALDNILIWNIKLNGWEILADFSLWCSHLEVTGARIIAFSKNQAIETSDVWLPQYNNYGTNIEIKNKHHRPRKHRISKFAQTWEI